MITLRNITLRRGLNVLLNDVNWTLYHKQHVGIIGANGTGKSSLFSLILKQIDAEVGEIQIPKQLKLSHVAQETPAYAQSALEYVLDGDTELRQFEKELEHAEQHNLGEQIAHLHGQLAKIDAYTAKSRAAQLLDGLGFTHQEQYRSVNEFSGGWRVRLNLAKALMCPSDILLLDEPTNHLDLDAVLWLEQWLTRYPGTLLLISHDREFLDHTVDHIAHLHQQNFKIYAGNYSAFEKQRAAHLLAQQSAYEKQQKHITHMQSFVDRFKAKSSKAAQAQSRLKAIEKIELISAVHLDSPFTFHFKEPKQCSNPLLRIANATIAYDEKCVLRDISISLGPKDRIGILGPNGAGKSSLIKLLAGELTQKSGIREASTGLKIGYFAQHQVDHLNLNETPLHHLRQFAPGVLELELRTFLGSFAFSGDRVAEPIKNFSGGEKSRLALALIVWQRPNLLLLDEPTNHLDLDMREALSLALQEYEGAMLLVSHDRFLVRTTVDQLLLVAEQKVSNFDGDLDDYERWLLDFRKKHPNVSIDDAEVEPISKKMQRQLDAKHRDALRPLLKKIKELENNLTQLETQLATIEHALTDNSLYEINNKDKLQRYLMDQGNIKKRLATIENAWLLACEERDTFGN